MGFIMLSAVNVNKRAAVRKRMSNGVYTLVTAMRLTQRELLDLVLDPEGDLGPEGDPALSLEDDPETGSDENPDVHLDDLEVDLDPDRDLWSLPSWSSSCPSSWSSDQGSSPEFAF